MVLLTSGATVTWSHHAMINGDDATVIILYTIILGLFFTFLQGAEYYEAGFNISDRSYGSSFFVTTGFHGTHVIIGSLFLIYCLRFLIKSNLTK
jgi:heme/copper-type cytochrome/quinol oxidase subunit 3